MANCNRKGDMIDKLIFGTEVKSAAPGSPMRLDESQLRPYGSAPVGFSGSPFGENTIECLSCLFPRALLTTTCLSFNYRSEPSLKRQVEEWEDSF